MSNSAALQLWQRWVEREIGGSQQRQAVAMQAILRAIRDGKPQAEIIQDALAVVGAQTQGQQASRLPSFIPVTAKPGIKGPFGVVSGLQRTLQKERGTQGTVSVWTFRVRPQSSSSLIPITLRSLSLQGSLADGDLVLVDERAASKSGSNAIIAYNYTTGGAITRGTVQYADTGGGGRTQLKVVRGVVRGWVPYSERRSNNWRDQGVVIAGWSFRIAITDPLTRAELFVPVEMRAIREIKGVIRNGDEVEVPEVWRYGETLTPKLLVNVSTSTTIKASAGPALVARNAASTLMHLVFAGIFLSAIPFIFGGGHTRGLVPTLLVICVLLLVILPIYRQWK